MITELLKRHLRQQYDDKTKLEDLPPLLRIIVSHLDVLHQLLNGTAPDGTKVTLTVGTVESLGFHRLKIMEFFMVLSRTNLACIDKELMQRNILGTCLVRACE